LKSDDFTYKTSVAFAIVSNEVEPEILTKELNIVPEKSFIKGELSVSKRSGSLITRPHNLWRIESPTTESEKETISHHIEYLKSILLAKIDILKKYKEDSRFELSFWIWVETDNAGIGLDLDENDLAFVGQIANRIHFSVITRESKQQNL